MIEISNLRVTKVQNAIEKWSGSKYSDSVKSKFVMEAASQIPLQVSLKKNLQEMYDFVKIDKRWWRLIKSWYEYDFDSKLLIIILN